MDQNYNKLQQIKGAEAIVIHNGNVVLGMQKPKRWYDIGNSNTGAIIKTLGGKIELKDNNSSRNAIIREVLEEVTGIDENDIKLTKFPIFTKRIRLGDLNPFENSSNLIMNADFFLLKIASKANIKPNDLPALVEIPINNFLKLEFSKTGNLSTLEDYIITNKNYKEELPNHYALMVPKEVKHFFERFRKDKEDVER